MFNVGFPGGSGEAGLICGSGISPGEGNSNSIVFQIFWCFQFFTYKYCSGNIWKKKKRRNICLCTFWQFVSLVVFVLEVAQMLYIHLRLESKLANCILKKLYWFSSNNHGDIYYLRITLTLGFIYLLSLSISLAKQIL